MLILAANEPCQQPRDWSLIWPTASLFISHAMWPFIFIPGDWPSDDPTQSDHPSVTVVVVKRDTNTRDQFSDTKSIGVSSCSLRACSKGLGVAQWFRPSVHPQTVGWRWHTEALFFLKRLAESKSEEFVASLKPLSVTWIWAWWILDDKILVWIGWGGPLHRVANSSLPCWKQENHRIGATNQLEVRRLGIHGRGNQMGCVFNTAHFTFALCAFAA